MLSTNACFIGGGLKETAKATWMLSDVVPMCGFSLCFFCFGSRDAIYFSLSADAKYLAFTIKIPGLAPWELRSAPISCFSEAFRGCGPGLRAHPRGHDGLYISAATACTSRPRRPLPSAKRPPLAAVYCCRGSAAVYGCRGPAAVYGCGGPSLPFVVSTCIMKSIVGVRAKPTSCFFCREPVSRQSN